MLKALLFTVAAISLSTASFADNSTVTAGHAQGKSMHRMGGGELMHPKGKMRGGFMKRGEAMKYGGFKHGTRIGKSVPVASH